MNVKTSEFHRKVEELLRGALEPLADRAHFDVEALPGVPDFGGEEVVYRIRGSAEQASLAVHVEDETELTLSLGTSVLDIMGKTGDEERVLAELREVVDAVLAGRYRETIWLVDGEPAKIVGELSLPDGLRRFSYWPLGWVKGLLGKRRRVQRHYAPY